MTQLSISHRFNGPPDSGNGGYSCGVLAAFIDGPSTVRLHVPPPLDTPLSIVQLEDGAVEMHDGEVLVGSGRPQDITLDIPPAPTLEQATEASKGFPCYEEHTYGTCFVCGPSREADDGLCLFPGPVNDWQLLACPWEPSPDMLDSSGNVRPEIVWSALDCPGFFAAAGENLVPMLLGELWAKQQAPVPGDSPLVVFSWPLGGEGRKLYGGVAIATRSGEILACSRTTWITLK